MLRSGAHASRFGRVRRRAALPVLVVAATIGSIAASATGSSVTVDAAPVSDVRFVADGSAIAADGGAFAIRFGFPSGPVEVVDVGTAQSWELETRPRLLTPDGRFAFSGTDDGQGVVREDVRSGAIEQSTVPFDGPSADLWAGAPSAVDDAGRFVLFDASNGAFGRNRTFLFDTATQTLLTPDPDGLTTGSRSSGGLDLSADGSVARFSEIEVGGQNVARYAESNRSTGQIRSVERPDESSFSSDWPWVASNNRRWVAFFPDDTDGRGGRDVTRLVRRDLETGSTVDVPLPAGVDGLTFLDVADDGTLAFTSETASGDDQLFVWTGGTTADQISLAADGGQPNGEVAALGAPFEMTSDGSRIVFRSFATDLTSPPTPEGDAPGATFVVDLDSAPDGPERSGKLQRSERVCVDAVGAEPGEYVGLNITPVRGSGTGFVTAHSSDVVAGDTSNANYTAGSIDPNVAFVRVGRDGRVCVTNGPTASVDLAVDQVLVAGDDVLGDPGGGGARRLADTRSGLGGRRLGPAATLCIPATGATPGDFVGVNVTPVRGDGVGFATAHSSDVSAGSTSNVNYRPGSIDPNLSFTQVGSDAKVCVTNGPTASVDMIVDLLVVAESDAFSLPSSGGARRALDTRDAEPVGRGGIVCTGVVGTSTDPSVGVNITPVRADGTGFVTLRSTEEVDAILDGDLDAETTSSANYTIGSIDPNLSFADSGSGGEVCITNARTATVDVIVDVLVVVDPGSFRPSTPDGPVRIIDTRTSSDLLLNQNG